VILSVKQKRVLKERVAEKFPNAELLRIRSVQKAYTDSKVKIILLEAGKEQTHYLDLAYLRDEKGNGVLKKKGGRDVNTSSRSM